MFRVQGSWFRVAIIAAVTLSTAVAYAGFCLRCRRSGCNGGCVYQKAVVAQAVEQTSVYVIQNNGYSAPIGQGTSLYASNGGLQAAVLPLYDPTIVASGTMEVIKAITAAAPLAMSQVVQHSERLTALQAPAVERLAAGQAAQMVLQAAGLDTVHQSGGASTAVVIQRDAAGQLQVRSLSTAEVQGLNTTIVDKFEAQEANNSALTTNWPQVTVHCLKCHGADVAATKGAGFRIGADLESATRMDGAGFYRRMQNKVISGEMPKGSTLSKEEMRSVLTELDSMIETGLAQSQPED